MAGGSVEGLYVGPIEVGPFDGVRAEAGPVHLACTYIQLDLEWARTQGVLHKVLHSHRTHPHFSAYFKRVSPVKHLECDLSFELQYF